MSPQSDPEVVRSLREYRLALLAREDAQLARMAEWWYRIETSLQDEMLLLAQEIKLAQLTKGVAVTEQLIAEMNRYKVLDEKMRKEILAFVKEFAIPDISAEQLAYLQHGINGSVAAINASFLSMAPAFNTLSVTGFETLIGMLGDGTPLYRLLKEAYPDALDGVIKAMLEGFAKGLSPNQIAMDMSKGMGMGLDRITLIARTEQLRVWRTSTVEQYRESGVVTAFKRLAAKDEFTCLACLAADGELIPLGEELDDHPRGRCTAVPVVIGAPETTWQTGSEWFDTLPPDKQEEMLGENRYEAWKEGTFDFADLNGNAHSDVWGDSPRVPTLEELGIK